MRKLKLLLAVPLLLVIGCTSVEKAAYNTVVAAKAFTDKTKMQHPECSPVFTSTLCTALRKAIAAKDVLIDAGEEYCAGPNFNGGGACDPPKKGTPAYVQAVDKLNAAMSSYSQSESDLKAVLN
jgi:hypothetical protein